MSYKTLFILLFLVSQVSLAQTAETKSEAIAYSMVENPPLPPDCKAKWKLEKRKECTNKFVQTHLVQNFNQDLAAQSGVTGRIVIRINFDIDTQGNVTNVMAQDGPLVVNQHAIDVIKKLPQFTPGTQDGKPVAVSYNIPLAFYVAE